MEYAINDEKETLMENKYNNESKLAIIILNYNTWELTHQFIRNQLSKLNLPRDTQIIVIDNASSNDSAIKLQQAAQQLDYVFIESKRNVGYAAGNNIAMEWAYEHGYKYGWITNTDIEFEDSETVNNMLEVFSKDPDIAVVSPRVFTKSGMETNRNLFRPSVYDLTFGKIHFRKKGRTVPQTLKGIDDTYCYNYRSQGCCMVVDLSILHQVNFMDEHTFLYMEEPILAERLKTIGVKEGCALNTIVVHNHSTTVASVAKRKQIYKWQIESEIYYYKQYRHFNGFQIWLCTCFTWLYFWVVMSMKRFN